MTVLPEIGVFNTCHPYTSVLTITEMGSEDGAVVDRQYNFGSTGDVPVAGDWNLDGKSEIGVYRPSMLKFYMDFNGNEVRMAL